MGAERRARRLACGACHSRRSGSRTLCQLPAGFFQHRPHHGEGRGQTQGRHQHAAATIERAVVLMLGVAVGVA